MTLLDMIKEWKKKREGEIEIDEPPKEMRDKYLESLRRERQYQLNQEEKIRLKKTIAEYKKKKMAQLLYGIKDKKEKRKSYLGDHMQKVKVLNEQNSILKQRNLMKQRSIMQGNSLLNNRIEEFKRKRY